MQATAAQSMHIPRRLLVDVGQPPAVRRVNRRIREAAGNPFSAVRPSLMVCDPQGAKDRRLQGYLLTIEPRLIELAASFDDVGFSVANVDKSRQSAINKLGGMKAAGDMAMLAYWNIVERAASLVGAINESTLRLNLIRMSSISDEGVSIIAGRGIPDDIAMRFKGALRYARREADLKQYRYTYVVPYGDNEAFDLDLHSFSRVLRHPEMVVSCKCSVSNPRRVSTDDREGFIQDEVKRLENRENDFYELLPESFRIGNGGTAEVQTPFGTSLYKKGIERVDSGVFVEIKLLAKEGDARALRRFTKDTAQWTGTKKGHMETMSLLFGMRGFNTFMGKPRTNSILTPITHAMKDLEATGAAVLPVNGGYLQYWADLPDNGLTAELMRKSLNHRIKCMEGMGPEYANLDFEPSVLLIDAKGTGISELRQRFILKSMGRESLEPQVLDKTDFLINFFENVHPAVQERVFSRMSQEGAGLSRADRMHVEALRRVCSLRRTIRDTEDLVWVLRRDDTLPDEIIASKREHEDWLFSFSAEKAGKVVRLLAEEIYNVARRK